MNQEAALGAQVGLRNVCHSAGRWDHWGWHEHQASAHDGAPNGLVDEVYIR